MFGLNFPTAPAKLERIPTVLSSADASVRTRRIVLLRSGRRYGPVTRLITPWDLGELTQPFLFLAHCEFAPGWQPLLAVAPQPGIATLTLVLSGTLGYRDEKGNEKTLTAGGCRCMTAGEGGRYDDGQALGGPLRAVQLWMALSRAPESSVAEGRDLALQEMPEEGPVRVILGQFGRANSALAGAVSDINYFQVRLRDGEPWRYNAPDHHNVIWLAVDRGGVRLRRDERVSREQIAVFGDSGGAIELQAEGETSFVLGSARRLAHPLLQDSPLVVATLTALTPVAERGPRAERRLRAQGHR